MKLDPIALSIPGFFALIGLELWVARRRGRDVYRVTDAVTDLACGVTSQLGLIFYRVALLSVYALVYERFRLHTFKSPALTWIVAFFVLDFLYYWWHRLSHERNILWAAHVVHHTSEDYNLAVALRQAVLTAFTILPFYLPLALLGIPPLVYATTYALSTLYQFWIHTQLIGKVGGPVGFVLNMPHHHRVHHAINPRYLDKNYGATLIVWDRLFGTFAEEDEECVYGVTKPLASFDPMWAQVHYVVDMAKMMRAEPGLPNKLMVPFRSPAWAPASAVNTPPPPLRSRIKFDVPISKNLRRYVLVNYSFLLTAAFLILLFTSVLPLGFLTLGAGALLAGMFSMGALIEGKSWARPAEAARVTATLLGLALYAVAR